MFETTRSRTLAVQVDSDASLDAFALAADRGGVGRVGYGWSDVAASIRIPKPNAAA